MRRPSGPNLQQEFVARRAWKQSVLATINVLTAVLAVRLVVLTSVAGGIALTWLCLQQPDPYRLGALALYGAFVSVPSVWLASRK